MNYLRIIKPGVCRVQVYQGECQSCGCVVEANKEILHSEQNLCCVHEKPAVLNVSVRCPTSECPNILHLKLVRK